MGLIIEGVVVGGLVSLAVVTAFVIVWAVLEISGQRK